MHGKTLPRAEGEDDENSAPPSEHQHGTRESESRFTDDKDVLSAPNAMSLRVDEDNRSHSSGSDNKTPPSHVEGSPSPHAETSTSESVGLMQRLVDKSGYASNHKHAKGVKQPRAATADTEIPGRSTILESWYFYNVNGVRVCVTNAFKYPVLQSLVYSKLKGYAAVLPWDASSTLEGFSPASVVFEVIASKIERKTIDLRQLGVASPKNPKETTLGTVKVPFSDFVKARLGNRLNPIQRWYSTTQLGLG
jgi:hypothetical protein